MRLSVYLALVGSLLLCVLVRRVGRRLPPPMAAVTLAVSALLAAGAWLWNLALLVGPLAGRVSYVAAAGHWSRHVLAAHDPVPAVTSAVATALVALAAASLAWAAGGLCREIVQVARALRGCDGGTDDGVVVVEDDAVRALAVPGRRGRVLITTGMVHSLDAEERRVVLAHERAHLRHGHVLYRLAVRLSAAVFPPVRPLVAECDYQLERWADEEAARAVGNRRVAARALARAALAGRRQAGPGLPTPALGFADRGVTGRVEALLSPGPAVSVLPLIGLLGFVAAVACATVDASRDLEALFELAQRVLVG
ncbi:MAG: M56 family metallopeptidase [Actinomycetota bacterium]|nr:M56 family metallopeptidase [Actinomycetota bacterium]